MPAPLGAVAAAEVAGDAAGGVGEAAGGAAVQATASTVAARAAAAVRNHIERLTRTIKPLLLARDWERIDTVL